MPTDSGPGNFTFDRATGALLTTTGGGGSSSINIAQILGATVALSNPLPVELSDGTNPFGTAGNPLSVNVISGGGSNASVGVTGATAPTSATEIGAIDASGKLQGASAANPVPVTIAGAAATGGNVKTQDGTPGTQFIFQEILSELRAIRKLLSLVYEESGEGDPTVLLDSVNMPTNTDYN